LGVATSRGETTAGDEAVIPVEIEGVPVAGVTVAGVTETAVPAAARFPVTAVLLRGTTLGGFV
jgi:endonuclease V-like protein UPF0215 family